jgi:hypothetical protein
MKLSIYFLVIIVIAATLYLSGLSTQKKIDVDLNTEVSVKSKSDEPMAYVETGEQEASTENPQIVSGTIEVNHGHDLVSSPNKSSPVHDNFIPVPVDPVSLLMSNSPVEGFDIFTVDEAARIQEPTNPDFSTYGMPIVINENNLRNLKKGQTVNFPTGVSWTMQTEKVERRGNGSVKISFSFPGHTNIYRGFITVGTKATYGRIITPEGGFELEVVGGNGWIVDTRKIDEKFPENGIDYQVPTI